MPSGVMVRFLYYKGPVMGTNPRPGALFTKGLNLRFA